MLPAVASGDDYVGGLPLTTVQSGTVSGDLWFDATPAPHWGDSVVTKTFTIPAAAVAEPGRITWARLYVSAYCGHMQDDKAFTITNRFDGDGDGTYETTWPETGHAPFQYVLDDDGNIFGNDNRALGGGEHDPYKMISDHENRVTSDYFMWYDVADLLEGETVNVQVDTTGSYDGRIKLITLVIAYDDPDSTVQTLYWVNQGHDACSYYMEESYGEIAVGSTSFGTDGLSGIASATLTAEYLASNNGYYGFPTEKNNFMYDGSVYPARKEGSFTRYPLDRVPDMQAAYSGLDSWDVTSLITGESDVKLAYARYLPGTGLAAFYKIPLAFLVVKKPLAADAPIAGFSATPASGNAPLTVQFTDTSTGEITGRAWDFENDGTVDTTEKHPSHVYNNPGTYTVTLQVTGPGGDDCETKTVFITVTPAESPVAAFTVSPVTGVVPLTVAFTDLSAHSPVSWLWEYRNESSDTWTEFSTSQNPEFTFKAAGTYDVRLTASNDAGNDDEVRAGAITTSDAPPVAEFIAIPRSGYPPLEVTFTDLSSGTITGWAWDFDNDGTTDSTEQNPSFTYPGPGTFSVNLTVTGPGGTDAELKTDYITAAVTANAPNAEFSANRTVVNKGYPVRFTDKSGGIVTVWAWDFNNDGTTDSTAQDPEYIFTGEGTYSVNLAIAGPGGADNEKKIDYIKVRGDPDCDLTITGAVAPVNLGAAVFAKEANAIRILGVTNNGPAASPATTIELVASDGNKAKGQIPALESGASTTVTIPDTTVRTSAGASIQYTVTVDPEDEVAETEEGNNVKVSARKNVIYNGYKGKRYWDGGDITTAGTFDLRGGLVHSFGDSSYRSGSFGGSGWTSYTVTWDETSLTIPENATVRAAILYVPYTWDNSNEAGTISISFNGASANRGSSYEDRSNFGAYTDYDYGLQVYDVTSPFRKNVKNTAIFRRGSSGAKLSVYGLTLAVVYEDNESSRKQIFVNEGFDLLGADESNYGTNPEEATAYIPFTGLTVDPLSASRADLITFVASGDGEGNLLFDGAIVGGGWDFGSVSGPQVAVLARDVKGGLKKTGNIAAIRSTPGETPCMGAIQQFLIIDYADNGAVNGTATVALVANFTAAPLNGPAPLRVNFTDSSTGSPEGWAWDFGNDGVIDSTEQDPEHVFDKPGNYTVGLTVRNTTASSSARKTGYILVKNPVAMAAETATLTAVNPTVTGREMRAPPAEITASAAAVRPAVTQDTDPRHSRDLVVHLTGFFTFVAERVSGAVTSMIQNIPFFGDRGKAS